jgi:hypothetical protein
MYWLQFDGSGGGTEGKFNITLNEETRTSVNNIAQKTQNNSLKIFPQPAKHQIMVKSSFLEEQDQVNVKIYNHTGALLFSEDLQTENNQLSVILNSKWKNGVYLLSIQIPENKSISESFILKR